MRGGKRAGRGIREERSEADDGRKEKENKKNRNEEMRERGHQWRGQCANAQQV